MLHPVPLAPGSPAGFAKGGKAGAARASPETRSPGAVSEPEEASQLLLHL